MSGKADDTKGKRFSALIGKLWGKLYPEALATHRDERDADNLRSVWLLGVAGLVTAPVMLLVEFLTGDSSVFQGAAVYYIVVFAYFVMLSYQSIRKSRRSPLAAAYILFGLVLFSETLIETSLVKDMAAFLFPVFLITFPVFMLDYPIRIFSFEAVFSVLYVSIDLVSKHEGLVRKDVVRITLALIFTLVICMFLVDRRISSMTATKDTRDEATHDALTGIFNRGGGQDEIRELLASNVSGTFVLLDIDNFKHVNDTYGHEKGDEALKAVAQVLASMFRRVDVVMRMGGDEFIVYAVGMVDVHFVEEKMEQVKQGMHGIILNPSNGDHVSISAGCIVNLGSYPTYDSLYAAADKLLYHTKQHGKDGCSVTDREYNA